MFPGRTLATGQKTSVKKLLVNKMRLVLIGNLRIKYEEQRFITFANRAFSAYVIKKMLGLIQYTRA